MISRLPAVLAAPLVALAASSALAAEPAPSACAAIDEKGVAALFERWNASLQTGNPDAVTANYAPDAVLLPTVSNQPRTNPAEIRDYFVHFLEKHPEGRIDRRVIKIGCNVAQDVGLYTFKIKGGKMVPARYTYVYQYRDGQWLIAHHHSSAMPE